MRIIIEGDVGITPDGQLLMTGWQVIGGDTNELEAYGWRVLRRRFRLIRWQ